jgi:predicted  nucleic acid-binding Zn-ribbon protein
MSTPVPQLLKELHRLRRHLRDLQAEIDLGPRVMTIQQQKLAAEEQAHKDAHETLKRLKIQQKEDEVTLKQTEQNLEKYQGQLNTAGSKKEFDDKQTEIATATGKKGELEDTILMTIAEIEERTARLPAVEQRWKDAKAEFEQYKKDAAERLERMRADQEATQAVLAETEAKLPADVRAAYDRLVKKFGADALAAVVGRSCQQCRTAITEQQRLNLLGGAFLTCPQCARGLYPAEGV